MDRYIYSGGQFIYSCGWWEEWQGGEFKYTFYDYPLSSVGLPDPVSQWILLFDSSRNIGVALPRQGGQSFYAWIGNIAIPSWAPLYQVTRQVTPEIAVWAEIDVPALICEDARLRGQPPLKPYPNGEVYGQYGWDMGFQFSSLQDLASKLSDGTFNTPAHLGGAPICPRQVHRLAITAHGDPGNVHVDNTTKPALNITTLSKDNHFRISLKKLEKVLARNAVILFMSCNAGHDKEGDALLTALSLEWPDRKVVAFATVGWMPPGSRPQSSTHLGVCSEPGMRETWKLNHISLGGYNTESLELATYGPFLADFNRLPWASEFTGYAKVAQNGSIIKRPETPTGYPPP